MIDGALGQYTGLALNRFRIKTRHPKPKLEMEMEMEMETELSRSEFVECSHRQFALKVF